MVFQYMTMIDNDKIFGGNKFPSKNHFCYQINFLIQNLEKEEQMENISFVIKELKDKLENLYKL